MTIMLTTSTFPTITDLPVIQCDIRDDVALHNVNTPDETHWRTCMVVIRITDCSDHKLWYSNLVGKYVPFVRHLLADNCFMSREPDGYSNIVRVQDAELVEISGDEIDYIHYY